MAKPSDMEFWLSVMRLRLTPHHHGENPQIEFQNVVETEEGDGYVVLYTCSTESGVQYCAHFAKDDKLRKQSWAPAALRLRWRMMLHGDH